MSKIKEITFAIKRGLPSYSSVSAGITMELSNDDDPKEVFALARSICEAEAVESVDRALDEAAKYAKGQARNRAIKNQLKI